MKQLIATLFGLLMVLSIYANTNLNAKATLDTLPITFKETVPKLQQMDSGFPFVNKTKEEEYITFDKKTFKEKDKVTGKPVTQYEYTITAIDLTTDQIKSKLGSSFMEWDPKSTDTRDVNTPTINRLNIYCRSLTMNHSLWIPEADITIHAETIKMNANPFLVPR